MGTSIVQQDVIDRSVWFTENQFYLHVFICFSLCPIASFIHVWEGLSENDDWQGGEFVLPTRGSCGTFVCSGKHSPQEHGGEGGVITDRKAVGLLCACSCKCRPYVTSVFTRSAECIIEEVTGSSFMTLNRSLKKKSNYDSSQNFDLISFPYVCVWYLKF